MGMKNLYASYDAKQTAAERERAKLEAKELELREKADKLTQKADKLTQKADELREKARKVKSADWFNEICVPLAEELRKEPGKKHVKVFGPAGLRAEVIICLYGQ